MNIRPIRTDSEYRAALNKKVSALFDNEPEPDTPEGDAFEIMITLIEAYEAKHFPVDLPDPIEALKFRSAQSGLTDASLRIDRNGGCPRLSKDSAWSITGNA